MTPRIYVIGSLRNPEIPVIASQLRELGFDAFDDWYAAGPDADDCWRDYERSRGHTLPEALNGYAAWNVFSFDKGHLDDCGIGLLVCPAGRSCHMEFGYMVGQGKAGYVLLEEDPDRYDVMYRFARGVYLDRNELFKRLKEDHL